MQGSNYESIMRRRERRRRERIRRRRKIIFTYSFILLMLIAGAVFAFHVWREKKSPEKSSTPAEITAPKSSQESSSPEDETPDSAEDSFKEGEEHLNESDTAADTESLEASGKPDNWLKRLFAWFGSLFAPKEKGIKPNELGSEPSGGISESYAQTDENGQIIPMGDSGEDFSQNSQEETGLAASAEERLANLLAQAQRLAAGYDYDGAIALLLGDGEFSQSPEVIGAVQQYEAVKSTLVEYDISKITHVFFHSLVMDVSKAFDGDSDMKGYNQVMTTRDEFLKILQEMYNRGYVLVRLHDMAHEEVDENGNVKMVKGKILLPEGKKAFVMSQDDVCYYPYMDGDGFASRIVIGEDGKPACVMKMDDGTEAVGAYDLVPLLENFIQEHPDFSYKGARAVIAFTGYEGILGYRTAASYQATNPNYEADRQQAMQVAQCLRDNGWELASHSWGHRYLGQIDYEKFKTDTDKWEAEVESLIGATDIILFPFGDDIGNWHSYAADNQRFQYLYAMGFRYFCNVDSAQCWVQLGDTYLRQGRRNLDGYRMWQDIVAGREGRLEDRKLDDLFTVENVFDPARPTPVEWE